MSGSSDIRIIHAETPDHIRTARSLFKEYAAWLAIDLSFQNFEEEVAYLPGEYGPPDGRLILALVGGEAVGCVALRKFRDQVCEMKRMWVRPHFRGQHIGRVLAQCIIREARSDPNAVFMRLALE